MRYYVYAPNGQRYGPADLATMQQWVAEGRILPHSLVEHELSGERMAASTVQGLQFTTTAPYAPSGTYGGVSQPGQSTPYAAYNRPGMAPMMPAGNNEITVSWVCGALGISGVFGCGWIPFGGIAPIILGALGMWQASKARELGHPQGNSAYTFNLVVLVLGILGLVCCTFYVFGSMPFFW